MSVINKEAGWDVHMYSPDSSKHMGVQTFASQSLPFRNTYQIFPYKRFISDTPDPNSNLSSYETMKDDGSRRSISSFILASAHSQ